jgi:hypothetical protein
VQVVREGVDPIGYIAGKPGELGHIPIELIRCGANRLAEMLDHVGSGVELPI